MTLRQNIEEVLDARQTNVAAFAEELSDPTHFKRAMAGNAAFTLALVMEVAIRLGVYDMNRLFWLMPSADVELNVPGMVDGAAPPKYRSMTLYMRDDEIEGLYYIADRWKVSSEVVMLMLLHEELRALNQPVANIYADADRANKSP